MEIGYNERLANLSANVEGLESLPLVLSKDFAGGTRAYYFNGKGSYADSPNSVLNKALYDAGTEERRANIAVCVIENISAPWIQVIGEAWHLVPEFFLDHAKNPSKENLWDNVFNRNRDPLQSPLSADSNRVHITGVFGYPDWQFKKGRQLNSSPNVMGRHCWDGPKPYPVSSNTRISYYRVTPTLYLFLVDAPIDLISNCFPERPRSRPTLRLPYSSNRGGLMLPSLYSNSTCGLFESFISFFTHTWHFHILFSPTLSHSQALPHAALLYLLSASLWGTNLRFLDREIKRISFNDLRQPTVQINSRLHDCREDLALLREFVTETRKYYPETVVKWHNDVFSKMPCRKMSLLETFDGIIKDTDNLSGFLMDSFQLLMSTVSTLASQTSLEQARRGTRLTQLAFIYVPLSFVTSIFGMNLKEINGSKLGVWVAFVSLFIVTVCTAAIFWLLESFKRYKEQITPLRPKMAGISRKDASRSWIKEEVIIELGINQLANS